MPTRLTIHQIENLQKRFRPIFELEDYVKSRDSEINVAKEIERLSNNKLEVIFSGLGAGDAIKVEKWEYDPKRPLDLTVVRKGKDIARIEVQTDYRYTFDRSKFFPIQEHKIMQAKKSNLPHYFVYILSKENKYYWLPTETIEKYEAIDLPTWLKDQLVIQRQHPVPKHLWNEGIEGLVKTILK